MFREEDDIALILFIASMVAAFVFFLFLTLNNTSSDFKDKHAFVQECIMSEQYSREECILLAAGE